MNRDGMTALIGSTSGAIARAWRGGWQHVRDANTVASIEERIRLGRLPDLVAEIDRAAAAIAAGVHGAYVAAGQATARAVTVAPVRKRLVVFDAAAPRAVEWAQRNRLELIREVSAETRDTIRQVLIAGARAGTNPREVAREVRESLGLTAHQERIVANYRAQLEQGRLSEALQRELTGGRADRTLAAAARDGKALTGAQIDRMVDAYRENWRMYRAENIARTEGLRVAHQASREVYKQAVERGDLDGAQIQRKWVHTHRAGRKSRNFHVAMNGQIRGLNELFESGRGVFLMYPGDPTAGPEETNHCTCVVTTRLVSTLV